MSAWSNEPELVSSFELKLVCDLTEKTFTMTSLTTSDKTKSVSGEVIEISVMHLSSNPKNKWLSIKSMRSGIRSFYSPLDKNSRCLALEDYCSASIDSEQFVASESRRFDISTVIMKDITIDRRTGRLFATIYNHNQQFNSTVVREYSGACSKAPDRRAF